MSIVIAAIIAAAAQQGAVSPSPSTIASSITAPVQPEGGAPRSKATRYCVIGTVTGSRMERKTCHTRDAWMTQGFDPLAASGK